MIKEFIKWFVFSVLMMVVPALEAQETSPVTFMRLNPYQTNVNVATDLPYYCYFSPGLGNFEFSTQYAHLGIRDLFRSKFSLSNLLDLLEDDNYISVNMNHNLRCLGVRAGDGIISYNHNFRIRGYASFNYCLFKLLAYGSSAFLGEENPATVRFDWDTQAYHEYAFGYQMNVTDDVSFGIRTKLLFGIADLTTDAFDMMLYTDLESDAVFFKEDVSLRFSLPRLFQLNNGSINSDGPFGLSDFFHNPGFGLDLAASFRLGDRFNLALAINDLGFIRWKENNMQLIGRLNENGGYYEEDALAFHGIDSDQLKLFFTDKEYRSAIMDTLSECFDFQTLSIGDYKTKLPTSFLVRGSFDVNESNRFIAQFQGCFRGDGFRPAFTMAYNGCFFNKIDLCGTVTMMKGSILTTGLGVGFKFGAFQMYAASSNWLNLNIGGEKVRNYQAGIVFTVGQVEKDKSHSEIPLDEE